MRCNRIPAHGCVKDNLILTSLGSVEAAPQIPPQPIPIQLTSADSFKPARCPLPDLESSTEEDNAPLKMPAQAPFDINVPFDNRHI